MPSYDFKCKQCGNTRYNQVMPISKFARPTCECGQQMLTQITKPPMVHWKDPDLPDGGFKAVGIPGQPVVTSLKQNRELMKKHDLVDANDFGPPPGAADQEKTNQQVLDSIKKIEVQDKNVREQLDIV